MAELPPGRGRRRELDSSFYFFGWRGLFLVCFEREETSF